MPKFCPNCGEDITDKVKFCPSCRAEINSFLIKPDNAGLIDEKKLVSLPENKKINEKSIEKKKNNFRMLDVIVYTVAAIIILILISTVIESFSNSSNDPTSVIVTGANQENLIILSESQTDKNTRIANEIVATYHKTHTYSLNDFYVCGDMASDVWDMLKAQGINAKINVGSIDSDITTINDADHVWVLAEVAPNQYLALEATGGYSVKKATNPRYYTGWSFYNPKQLKNYQQLSRQYNDALIKYKVALNDYNAAVAQYNNAGLLTRISLKSQLDDKELILQQRDQDLLQIMQQISALLSNL